MLYKWITFCHKGSWLKDRKMSHSFHVMSSTSRREDNRSGCQMQSASCHSRHGSRSQNKLAWKEVRMVYLRVINSYILTSELRTADTDPDDTVWTSVPSVESMPRCIQKVTRGIPTADRSLFLYARHTEPRLLDGREDMMRRTPLLSPSWYAKWSLHESTHYLDSNYAAWHLIHSP